MISDYQTNEVSKLNKKSRFWTVCLLTFSILNTPKLQYSNKKGFEPQWFRCSLYLNLIKICITGVVYFYHYSGKLQGQNFPILNGVRISSPHCIFNFQTAKRRLWSGTDWASHVATPTQSAASKNWLKKLPRDIS